MSSSSVGRKIAKGFVWETTSKLFVQILSWLSTIVVARILAPEDYGLVAISGIFTGFLTLLGGCGLSAGLINASKITDNDIDTIFWFNLLAGVMLYFALYFSSPYIALYYKLPELESIIKLSAFVIILSTINIVPYALTMRELNFKFNAIVSMVGQFVNIATVLLMALNGFGVWSLIYSVLIGQSAVVLMYLTAYKRFPRLRFSFRQAKPVFVYGVAVMGSKLLESLTNTMSTFIVSSYTTQKITGYFSFSATLAKMPVSKLGTIFKRIAFPVLSTLKEDKEKAGSLFLKMHEYLLMLALPVLVGCIWVADDLLIILLSEKWAPAVPIVQIMCGISIFNLSGFLLPAILEGCGRPDILFRYRIISIVILGAALWYGVQSGLTFMMYTWLCVAPLLYVYLLWLCLRELRLSLLRFIKSIMPIIFPAVIMSLMLYGFVLLLSDMERMFRLIIMVSGGAIAYSLSILLIFPEKLQQIKGHLSLLKSK